jgi:carbonic anhydrase
MQTTRLTCLGAALIAIACGGPAQPPTAAPPPAAAAAGAPATLAVATPPPVAPAPTAEAKPKEPPHWKYEGAEGPTKWGELWPEWEKCRLGLEQSPIDLPKQGDKPQKPAPLVASYSKLPLQILNNGHTVQVPAAQSGKLSVDGIDYDLAQFHLHAPSEHTVAGAKFDGELHLVHKNAKGELAVIGILLKKGKENKTLAPVFAAAPAEESHEAKPVADATLDLTALVPAKSAYYSYSGSLTTPPCTEGVKWFVLTKPAEVSEAQLKKFSDVMHGGNARPVLQVGARKILQVKP